MDAGEQTAAEINDIHTLRFLILGFPQTEDLPLKIFSHLNLHLFILYIIFLIVTVS